jgi:hypothetical protein
MFVPIADADAVSSRPERVASATPGASASGLLTRIQAFEPRWFMNSSSSTDCPRKRCSSALGYSLIMAPPQAVGRACALRRCRCRAPYTGRLRGPLSRATYSSRAEYAQALRASIRARCRLGIPGRSSPEPRANHRGRPPRQVRRVACRRLGIPGRDFLRVPRMRCHKALSHSDTTPSANQWGRRRAVRVPAHGAARYWAKSARLHIRWRRSSGVLPVWAKCLSIQTPPSEIFLRAKALELLSLATHPDRSKPRRRREGEQGVAAPRCRSSLGTH